MTDSPEAASSTDDSLSQIASAMLTEVDLPDTRSVLCLLYNVMPDKPGRPSWVAVPTDPEMWDTMPHVRDALDLLTQITLLAPVTWPPGSRPAPLAHIRVDPRAGRRLDGIALLFRAWSLDNRTAAGQAVLANLSEGRYEVGDVAASPQRRDIRVVSAVGSNGARVALFRTPDGPVEDYVASMRAAGVTLAPSGSVLDGLELLLGALRKRFADNLAAL